MHRIVVLGAGYAGLAAVAGLVGRTRRRAGVRITVVNATEVFTERLRLHQVAAGQRTAALRLDELLAGTGVELVYGRVDALDAGTRTVRLTCGETLGYDTLVYALGGVADTVVPGAAEHAYALGEPGQAEALARVAPGTVVVCGTGLTGVEAAAELAARHPRVLLLGRAEPGDALGRAAREHLAAALRRLGVRVRAGVDVVKVLPDAVRLAGGETVAADAVLLASGVRANPLAATAGLAVDERGRVRTDAALRSVSHPEVYAVGDAAAVTQGYGVLHGTCQSGMPTGSHAAASIVRELDGKRPKDFRFGYYHTPISLGRDDAVVQFTRPDGTPRRGYLTGRAAVRYKETVSAAPWPTFRRMLRAPAAGAYWPRGGRYTR